MDENDLWAAYSRIADAGDRAMKETARQDRAVEIGRVLGVRPGTTAALTALMTQADKKYWRLCHRRHAAFNAWNEARKAADRELG